MHTPAAIPERSHWMRASLSYLLLASISLSKLQGSFDSYEGLIMTGYQGWFNTPDDGANKKWAHYSRKGKFQPGQCSIDFWPDVSEYTVTYATDFRFEDGSAAHVFSSYDPSTVDLHFKWMRDYGIDGAFTQRFIHSLDQPKIENHYDAVFDSAITAAEKYGRAISIRYDLTSMQPGFSKVLLNDLDELNAKHNFFDRVESPTFLYHAGKPIIAFGGIGFAEDSAGDDVGYLNEASIIISELRKRGYSLMMRVPAQWHTQRGGQALETPELRDQFLNICKSVDIIMPWHVGAYREDSYVSGRWEKRIREEIAWCEARGIDYVPVVYPGFSRANLKGGEDGSYRPRNGGSFFWLQAASAIDANAKMIFLAQFDEMDEGTQIFKASKRVPVGDSPFIRYDDSLETDHYLWLSGKIGEMLRNDLPFSRKLPARILDTSKDSEM
ncbi:MAG: glycoside hydrolase family 71/99-like protein [Opitutales bacterium]